MKTDKVRAALSSRIFAILPNAVCPGQSSISSTAEPRTNGHSGETERSSPVVGPAFLPVDVAHRDLRTRLFGEEFGAPLAISPTGMVGLARARADVHLARAAGQRRIPFTLSTVATVSLEEVAAAAPGPLWFQLYILRDRKLTERVSAWWRRTGLWCVSVDCPVSRKTRA